MNLIVYCLLASSSLTLVCCYVLCCMLLHVLCFTSWWIFIVCS